MPDLSTREQAMAWMDAERSNLHAAVVHAARHHWLAHASAIPAAMDSFLRITGHWDQARTLHQTAVEAARQATDPGAEARALINLGDADRLTGNYLAATASLEQALDLCRTLGDRPGEAGALYTLGSVQDLTGDYLAAAANLQQALRLYRALGDRLGEASALSKLGSVQRLTGDIMAATASLDQALELYEALQAQRRPGQHLEPAGCRAPADRRICCSDRQPGGGTATVPCSR